MKKLIVLILVVCLAFVGYISFANRTEEPTEPALPDTDFTEEAVVASGIPALNVAKLYESHDPNEVVMTINGQEITWEQYFYFVNTNADTVSRYLADAKNYGLEVSWEDVTDESGTTFLQYVTAYAEETLRQMVVIESVAQEGGAVIGAKEQAEIDAATESLKASLAGAGASDEVFNAALAELYLSRDFYERINRVNYLYQNGFTAIYGQDGANVSDEDALAYLQDNGYISANHILYLTVDMTSGQELDAETKEAKLAAANNMSEYMRGYEAEDGAALAARFAELKVEECEDSGKTAYPNGYVFLPGDMVKEFEDACLALGEYEVSEPILSSYGYHVIMRLPLDPDAVISFSNAGTPLTARSLFANESYAKLLDEKMASAEIVYAPAFENFSVADYLE